MNPTLDETFLLVLKAHSGQKDKAGQPYVLHLIRVMMAAFQDDKHQTVALLHDLVEDTDYTLDDLRAMDYDDEIIAAVDALSKRKGESYQGYVHRVGQNELATDIKIVDLRHNLDVCRLKRDLTDKDLERICHYHDAYLYLEAVRSKR